MHKTLKFYLFGSLIIAIFVACLFYDTELQPYFTFPNSKFLSQVMPFFLEYELLFVIMAVTLTISLLWNKKYETILALFGTLIVVSILTLALKGAIKRARPTEAALLFAGFNNLYSFPSLQVASACSVLPFLHREWRGWWLWLFITLGVAFSRLYYSFHYPGDVMGGALLGLAIGGFFVRNIESYEGAALSNLELHRKLFHLVCGSLFAFLFWYEIIGVRFFFIWSLFCILLSILYRYQQVSLLRWFVVRLERPRLRRFFPGKGAVMMMIGYFLAAFLFPKDIATVAMIAVAIGDSVSHIVGRYWGSVLHPLSSRKFIEGHIAGAFCSFLVAASIVSWQEALASCTIAMIVEGIDIQINSKVLDDNVIVPLVAGGVIVGMRAMGITFI